MCFHCIVIMEGIVSHLCLSGRGSGPEQRGGYFSNLDNKLGWPDPGCPSLNVRSPQNSCWNTNPQCDGVRRWGGGALGKPWSHEDGALMSGVGAFTKETSHSALAPPTVRMRWEVCSMGEGPRLTLLTSCSQTSGLQIHEEWISVVYKLLVWGILLQ